MSIRDWNRYAFIEDICVVQAFRGEGIGTALIQKATAWAKESGLNGLALETQDNNLLACRFYAKCGFKMIWIKVWRNVNEGSFNKLVRRFI